MISTLGMFLDGLFCPMVLFVVLLLLIRILTLLNAISNPESSINCAL